MTPPETLRPFAFVLAVPDLARNVAYFRDVLGFAVNWTLGNDWSLVTRGSVQVMMGHCPDALAPSATGDHSCFCYLHVDDADALHAELAARGAIILQPPTDRPHGMREFTVATPDGHRLLIGQDLTPPAQATPAAH